MRGPTASTACTLNSNLQQREFAITDQGYGAVRHQRFVGTGYFDLVSTTISGGDTSTNAMAGSTEEEQFETEAVGAGSH